MLFLHLFFPCLVFCSLRCGGVLFFSSRSLVTRIFPSNNQADGKTVAASADPLIKRALMAAEAQRISLCKVGLVWEAQEKDTIRLFRRSIFYIAVITAPSLSVALIYVINQVVETERAKGGDNKVNIKLQQSSLGRNKRQKKKEEEKKNSSSSSSAPLFPCHHRSDIFIVYGGDEWSVFRVEKQARLQPDQLQQLSSGHKTSSRGIPTLSSSIIFFLYILYIW